MQKTLPHPSEVPNRPTERSGHAPLVREPVVVLGGFLSHGLLYRALANHLRELARSEVAIVPTTAVDWLAAPMPAGWLPVLHRLRRTVRAAVKASPTGRAILVAHSAGGVLGRIYLSPTPFLGTIFRGCETVSHLITLGTPHYGRDRVIYGGKLSAWAERHCPGAYFADEVAYTAVAGKAIRGSVQGSPAQRRAYRAYRGVAGHGDDWGDGVVPLRSALLSGADPVVLDGVAHFAGAGLPWYGDREIVQLWWPAMPALPARAPSA